MITITTTMIWDTALAAPALAPEFTKGGHYSSYH